MSFRHRPNRRTYDIGRCSDVVLAVTLEIIVRDVCQRPDSPFASPDDPEAMQLARIILYDAQSPHHKGIRDEALYFAHGAVKVCQEQFGLVVHERQTRKAATTRRIT